MTLEEIHQASGVPLVEVPGGRLPLRYGDAAQELEAGLHAAALVDRSTAGRLRITGVQRLEYLQRIAAQNFDSLQPPQGLRSAILERRGKILDVVTVHAFPDHLLILTSAALHTPAAEWIAKFIFRDDVQVTDVTKETAQFTILGPSAADVVRSFAGSGAEDLKPYAWCDLPGSCGAILIGGARDAMPSYHVVGPAEGLGDLWTEVLQLGKGSGLRPMGEQAYQRLRILAGVPEGGAEVDDRSNPMELGQDDSYSLSKGCFPGQEVLAKMVTHKSVKRALVGLELEAASVPERGTAVHREGQPVGRITSAAALPGQGRIVGLALVAREHAGPGTMLQLDEGSPARVIELPFPEVTGIHPRS